MILKAVAEAPDTVTSSRSVPVDEIVGKGAPSATEIVAEPAFTRRMTPLLPEETDDTPAVNVSGVAAPKLTAFPSLSLTVAWVPSGAVVPPVPENVTFLVPV